MNVEYIILVFAALLLTGVMTAKFSSKLGVPSLVFFVLAGMVMNQFFYFDDAWLTQLIGTLALIIILFEGGLQTKYSSVQSVVKPALSLATLGVLITTVVSGAAAVYILDVSWLEGILFGAIVGSTDAAAVFSVLGGKNIKPRLRSVLEAESGSNDPMAVFLTITVIGLIQAPSFEPFSLLFFFLWQMGAGFAFGLLFGKMSLWLINRINLDSSGLYPVLTIGLAVLAFSLVTVFKASGFLTVYVMAVMLGNKDLTYRHTIVRFNEGFAWLMQIVMFTLLGLLVFPNQLLDVAWQGVLLAFILIFIARPAGVLLSLPGKTFSLNEKLFISWAGLKGAVPIILATYPLVAGIDDSHLIFNAVFFVVLLSALVQGALIGPAASLFKVEGKGKVVQPPHSLELISIGKTNSEIIEVTVSGSSVGKQIQDMDLPDKTLITAVIRGDKLITPYGGTVLLEDDVLYVLTPKMRKDTVKQVFTV